MDWFKKNIVQGIIMQIPCLNYNAQYGTKTLPHVNMHTINKNSQIYSNVYF